VACKGYVYQYINREGRVVRDPADAKCLRAMWVIFAGLVGLFVGLVMVARMVS
jgi:hypothetical protein